MYLGSLKSLQSTMIGDHSGASFASGMDMNKSFLLINMDCFNDYLPLVEVLYRFVAEVEVAKRAP